MASLFGDKQRFAAEVGEFSVGATQLRRVDLWAAGLWLTCDDNTAFVPQFCLSLQGDISEFRAGRLPLAEFPEMPHADRHRRVLLLDDDTYWRHRFPDWGPTTDNLRGLLLRAGKQLVLTFEFWRKAHPRPAELGTVFVAELTESELLSVLCDVVATLGCSPAPTRSRSRWGD